MKKFIFGIITGIVVLGLAGIGAALLGFIPTDANQTPGRLETWLADNAMDAYMERRAPRTNSPLPPTDANLIDGMRTYAMNCAVCHGGLDKKPAPLAANLYPPAPQLLLDAPDDPEWHIYYAIQHGIRNTGMPAWKGVISDDDAWKITAFLSHQDKLPQGVQDFWQKAIGAPLPAPAEHEEHEKKEGRHHH